MNTEQMEQIKNGQGFVVALDQSKADMPRVLRLYSYSDDDYENDEEMYELVATIYRRVISCMAFTSERIIGCIIPEQLLDKKIDDKYMTDYLWEVKGITPCVKLETELEGIEDGVQLIKEIPDLDARLKKLAERNIFAVKVSSMIKTDDEDGIEKIVNQQMELAHKIMDAGMVPILEPEIFFRAENKEEADYILSTKLKKAFKELGEDEKVMMSIMLPDEEDNYYSFTRNPNVLRTMAICAATPRGIAVSKLSKNRKVISGFNRAFLEGISGNMDDRMFNIMIGDAIGSFAKASNS